METERELTTGPANSTAPKNPETAVHIDGVRTTPGIEWNTDVSDEQGSHEKPHSKLRPFRYVIWGCEVVFFIGIIFAFASRPFAVVGVFLLLVALNLLFIGRFLAYLERLTLRRTG